VITLISSTQIGCERETTIEIEVDKPNPGFSVVPEFTCDESESLFLTADDASIAEYFWNGERGGPTFEIEGLEEPRDPLHINVEETRTVTLTVISDAECRADSTFELSSRLPDAYFIPDKKIGFGSLEVEFTDFSESSAEIVRRFWIYDDGTTQELDPNTTVHTHTYPCGLFYPRLVIEDATGCIDTSKQVEIEVLCPAEQPGTGSCNCTFFLDTVCINDIGEFFVLTDAFDFHLYTDDNRFSHCWESDYETHQFRFPGIYPSTLVAEYEGELIAEFVWPELEVFGARAEITYDKECGSRTFDFKSISINAEQYDWQYDGQTISTAESFSYTFDEPGEHEVSLSVTSTPGNCDADVDFVTVYVPELKADFVLPGTELCDSEPHTLDASNSTDVYNTCNKGYKWIFEDQRPRVTESPTLEHKFLRGEQDVSLVVQDINGCTDTISAITTAYDLQAEIDAEPLICLPMDASLENLSIGDTTIVNWAWDFGGSGSNLENPSHVFDTLDYDPRFDGDSITVTLVLTDALGCTDSTSILIDFGCSHKMGLESV